MTETDLAAAVKAAVDEWMRVTPLKQQQAELANPAVLSASLGSAVEALLVAGGFVMGAARQVVLAASYFHLKDVFVPGDLPDTPQSFIPVPSGVGVNAGCAAVLAVHGFLRMETVSYGAENGGDLFVNLVPMPGQGKFPEKSKKSMRGHTDGVSFPFNGDVDASNPRIAPSPDLVTLVGLRNPNEVPTKVMVLEHVLAELSEADKAELKKRQYSITAQATFAQGTKLLLGRVHVAVDEPILKVGVEGTHVRYSHSSVVPTRVGGPAEKASENFEAACNKVVTSVVVRPGDVLVVSNRLCLHGRGVVGDDVGGQARWLLRTYGLDTTNLATNRRHLGARPLHVLYP
ncbi:TauD/TfdA family dioxygenase [Burkholderia diffusa]|uniref:TauD/TfdA family dioxygenase n=1 Tax=Burkholderia diffusa TaxID=488732 RepID=UPI00157B3A60|nr:TauD/TfdA family dioxygenase [Burkholderia diffusa]NTY41456.1 taurine catabolism dioxygenase TauD [Burkholderia diffusa]